MTEDAPVPNGNSGQMASPSYRLAALDQDFLLGDSMRGVRFLLEYAKAEEALRKWGVLSTIVVFGSARVRPDGPGEEPRWYAAARDRSEEHTSELQSRRNLVCRLQLAKKKNNTIRPLGLFSCTP